MKILKSLIVILFLVQNAGCTQLMAFDIKGKLKDLTGQKDSASGDFDLSSGKTELMQTFNESSGNYLKALELIMKAYGLNVQAAQVTATIENYGENSNASEADQMKNSIKATTEASEALKKKMEVDGEMVSAEGKVYYAKSLPPAGKGLMGTIKLAPVSSKMVSAVSSNPLSALKEIGGLSKVIPQLPAYMKTIQDLTKLIISGAKANDIEGASDMESQLGDL